MSCLVVGWYGPLIDLEKASSHLDDFVQLIVFVRSVHPIQKNNACNGASLLKTNIQVGDDTRSFFSVSLWQKNMGSMVVAGDIILLQNVKIVKNRYVLEAATIHVSTLMVLIHSYELSSFTGSNEVVSHRLVGETARTKLRRVVNWVQHTESALRHIQNVKCFQRNELKVKNWKAHEGNMSKNFLSIAEALCLTDSCIANFDASVGDIVLPFILRSNGVEKQQSFVSKRLYNTMGTKDIVEEFISTGCKLCGSPIGLRSGPEESELPLQCPKSIKHIHEICLIYKPFLMYVWDQSGQIPLLVKNKAAQILFGNISAENVYKSYKEERKKHDPSINEDDHSNSWSHRRSKTPRISNTAENDQGPGTTQMEGNRCRVNPNFYQIWLILVKVLLKQDENSPFRFEIVVDCEKDIENGRFELVSFKMPCNDIKGP